MCGGAGGGGGSGARKTSGLMGWSEAYALWNALRIARVRNEDYLKGMSDHQFRQMRENDRSFLLPFLGKLFPRLPVFLAWISQPFSPFAQLLNQGLNRLQNWLMPQRTPSVPRSGFLSGMAEKLATLLGDARKLLDDIRQHNVENLKSLLARLRRNQMLQFVEGLVGGMLRQFAPSRVMGAIQRRVKSAVDKLFGLFGNEPEAEDALQPERRL